MSKMYSDKTPGLLKKNHQVQILKYAALDFTIGLTWYAGVRCIMYTQDHLDNHYAAMHSLCSMLRLYASWNNGDWNTFALSDAFFINLWIARISISVDVQTVVTYPPHHCDNNSQPIYSNDLWISQEHILGVHMTVTKYSLNRLHVSKSRVIVHPGYTTP